MRVMSPRATAFRLSVRDRRSKTLESLFSGAALGLPIKKAREPVPAMRRGAGPPGGKAVGGRSGERALGPAPYLPDPARELARHRHVGHARPLAGGAQRLVPAAEPGGRLVAAALDRGRHGGAARRLLRPGGARREVPGGLDQGVFCQLDLSKGDCGGNPGPNPSYATSPKSLRYCMGLL